MMSFLRRWSEWLYKYRLAALVGIILVTAFFAWELQNLDISTHFRDLLAKKHPNVLLFEKYPDFGSPFTVSLVVQVKKGNIYNYETFKKIQEAARLIDLVPGVDHNRIFSIASRKIKNVEATVDGIQAATLLVGEVPQSPADIAKLREKIRSTAGVMGTLVSTREDAAMIQATFHEQTADYNVIFNEVNSIIKKMQDNNHELYSVGQPILTGWVYYYQKQMYWLFGLGFLIMVSLLILYSRNLAGVLTPVIVGFVSAIWGFGFAGVLGYNLDPLIIVVPILLVARGLSHSVQMCGRYFEIYARERDVKEACVGSLVSLFPPGVVGIICDASGLFIIAVAPIPLVQKLAIVCGLWSLGLIVTAIVTTFLVLSYLPPPRNVEKIVLSSDRKQGVLYNIFRFLTIFSSSPRWAIGTSLVFLGAVVVSVWFAGHRQMGDVHPGTPLLWPDSNYNGAIKSINDRFAGFDMLQVVVENDSAKQYITENASALQLMQKFQRYMELDPEVGATFSFADYVPKVNQLFHSGLPKFSLVPSDDNEAGTYSYLARSGTSTKDFDHLVTPVPTAANIIVWYKDHRGKTIERALNRAGEFIDKEKGLQESSGVKLRLGSGIIGLNAANSEVIKRLEPMTVALISLVIFIVTTFIYRSFTAGLLLVLISNMANFMTAAVMYLMHIGLDVNTLPVAAVGMGIGIDYNIYLMSRMCEEYEVNPDYARLIPASILTTGKAIFFTATTMIGGVIIWYFMSSLRFTADMGLLLSAVMFAHVILALIYQAAVMRIIQPKFLGKGLIFRG
jgi:predicted RND superfamily exporter protein